MTDALATGLAIQGVETLVSVTCGSLGLAYLMQPSERVTPRGGSRRRRRRVDDARRTSSASSSSTCF